MRYFNSANVPVIVPSRYYTSGKKFDVRFCGLTAAGTVPDFHRVPFSFGRRKPPETISRLQNYLYYNPLAELK